jgi:ribonuclease P protein component
MVKKSFNVAALAAVRASAPKPALTALQPPDSRPVETTCGLIDPMSGDRVVGIYKLQKRWQFLACAKGRSLARGGVAVQVLRRSDDNPGIGVGFTATRKIGGAVQRNRAKRRMREAARQLLPLHSLPGHDYVFVARGGTIDRDWSRLLDDVRSALTGLANGADEPPRARKPKSAGSGLRSEGSGGSRSKPNPAKPSTPPPSAPDPPGKVSFDG